MAAEQTRTQFCPCVWGNPDEKCEFVFEERLRADLLDKGRAWFPTSRNQSAVQLRSALLSVARPLSRLTVERILYGYGRFGGRCVDHLRCGGRSSAAAGVAAERYYAGYSVPAPYFCAASLTSDFLLAEGIALLSQS